MEPMLIATADPSAEGLLFESVKLVTVPE